MLIFTERMNKEIESFDMFVDDIISSEDNLLKGELDFLLMQFIFESLDLENIREYNEFIKNGNKTAFDLAA